ncbi:glyoxylase I 4 [Impatiens glandulifera]|uniref:glyoxylase I 4 n=1 Tax=Impatiens glandulifera TaxID=253017 RepID=UPI001FB0D6C7|nr:glyoxylase I 4 [Impatiens glandulifera]
MAALLSSSLSLPPNKVNHAYSIGTNTILAKHFQPFTRNIEIHGNHLLMMNAKLSTNTDTLSNDSSTADSTDLDNDYGVVGMHHVGILCKNLEQSIDFYQNLLGLEINEARPHDKLPYRGAWFWVGTEMIHLMELPNPDPLSGRPDHAGRDRHACIAIQDVSKLKTILDKAGIPYTLSRSGRPALFTRDPDGNGLEFTQV